MDFYRRREVVLLSALKKRREKKIEGQTHEIASYLGLSRASLHRAITSLRDAGLIRYEAKLGRAGGKGVKIELCNL